MIFSNHMVAAFPPPSSLSMSPYIVLPSDNHHVHDQRQNHHDMMRRLVSFSGGMTEHGREFNNGLLNGGGDDELSDDGSQLLGEEKKKKKKKKKRLSMEQVKALERSFENGNKLEPERKSQLAKSLGLQPRQVAIWFQNRRARWKTKQLERDYEVLRQQVEVLKADNDALVAQNEKLRVEIMWIKARSTGKNPAAAEGSHWSNNGSNVSCDVNSIISRTTLIDRLKLDQNDPLDDSINLCKIFGNGVVVADNHHCFWPWTMTAVDQQHPLHP